VHAVLAIHAISARNTRTSKIIKTSAWHLWHIIRFFGNARCEARKGSLRDFGVNVLIAKNDMGTKCAIHVNLEKEHLQNEHTEITCARRNHMISKNYIT
jgi:hypothetical protein